MARTAQPRRLRTVELRLSIAMLCAIAYCANFSGCAVYPEPNRKSINELYFEALDASQQTPEHSLGLNPSNGGAARLGSDPTTIPASSVPGVPVVPDSHAEPLQMPSIPPASTTRRSIPLPSTPMRLETMPVETAAHESNVWRKSSIRSIRQVAYRSTSGGPAVVSENFEDTDVRQALQVLASQAGISIIVDEQISGTITALIEDEPFETALRRVLMPLGLVYRQTEDGEYIVAVPDPSSPLFSRVSERFQYQPMNVSPDDLLKLLSEREAKFVSVVDKRNLILIEAPAEIGQPILEHLKQNDIAIPQVELEAIVCVIAPDRGFKSGLDWSHAVTLNGSEVLNVGMTGLAFGGKGSPNGANGAFSNFAVTAAFVKLLAQEGYLTIRAAPRVTARDGEPAKIAITRQSYFSTQPTSSTGFFNYQIQQVEAGITLEIIPTIRGDNITVQIDKAEVSEDIRTTDVNASVANNPYPLINKRSVSTTVNVKDTETIVIGGLVQQQTVDRISKVPVLGDIPYAGRLFQTVEQLEQDVEVVIFISPRIVRSSQMCLPENGGVTGAMESIETASEPNHLSQPVIVQ